MAAFARGLLLVKSCWKVLLGDRELMLATLLGSVCTLLAAAAFILPGRALEMAHQAAASMQAGPIDLDELLFLFAFLLTTSFIGMFFNAALAAMLLLRLRGEGGTLSDGLRVATDNVDRIFIYACISATVGLVLSQLERSRLIGRLVGTVIGTAWSLTTFLVIPVMIAEGCGPLSAIARSGRLLRQTWGEQLSGNSGMGLVFLGFALIGFVPLMFALPNLSAPGSVLAVILTAGYLGVLAILASTLGQIFRVAVYVYATTGVAPEAIPAAVLGSAFTSTGGNP